MQTKSPLARIGIMAGIPIAALVLFMSVHTHRRAHSSQAISNNHTGATAPSATSLTAAQITNFTNAYGKLPLAFEANRAVGSGSALRGARPELSIVPDEPGSSPCIAPARCRQREIRERRVTCCDAHASQTECRGKNFRSAHAFRWRKSGRGNRWNEPAAWNDKLLHRQRS